MAPPPVLPPEQLTNPAIRIKVAEAVGGMERRVEDAERQLESTEKRVKRGDKFDYALLFGLLTMAGTFAGWVIKQAEKRGDTSAATVVLFKQEADARSTGIEVQLNELRRDTNERDRRLEQKIDALDTMMRTLDRDLRKGRIAK